MPAKNKQRRIARQARKNIHARKNSKKQGRKRTGRPSPDTPAIIANSLFALTLKPVPGIVVEWDRPFYWLDIGNLQKTGQVVLGTVNEVKQPKSDLKTKQTLPDVVKKFPQLKKIKEEKQGPSCSLAEALTKQDLYINSTLAEFGCGIIWKQFREGMIKYHGCFVNVDSFTVNPIKIQ